MHDVNEPIHCHGDRGEDRHQNAVYPKTYLKSAIENDDRIHFFETFKVMRSAGQGVFHQDVSYIST